MPLGVQEGNEKLYVNWFSVFRCRHLRCFSIKSFSPNICCHTDGVAYIFYNDLCALSDSKWHSWAPHHWPKKYSQTDSQVVMDINHRTLWGRAPPPSPQPLCTPAITGPCASLNYDHAPARAKWLPDTGCPCGPPLDECLDVAFMSQ